MEGIPLHIPRKPSHGTTINSKRKRTQYLIPEGSNMALKSLYRVCRQYCYLISQDNLESRNCHYSLQEELVMVTQLFHLSQRKWQYLNLCSTNISYTNLLLNTTSPNFGSVLLLSDMREMSESEHKSHGGTGPNIMPGVENSHCLTPGHRIMAVNQLYMMSRCVNMYCSSTQLALACLAEYKSITKSVINDWIN